jgi:ribonuclease-3
MKGSRRRLLGSISISPERSAELERLQARIGYSFKTPELLECALIHRSYAYERHIDGSSPAVGEDYECLEFLGDAILGFVVSEHLYRLFPKLSEGDLSKLKSFLVSTNHLAALSRALGLGDFLRLSYGEEKTGGRSKKAILADLFESLTAAVYLDSGWIKARAFVLAQFTGAFGEVTRHTLDVRDYKSNLQERLHTLGRSEPQYVVVDEAGPAHRRQFVVEVRVAGSKLAAGEGKSKKEAQQKAACQALESLAENAANQGAASPDPTEAEHAPGDVSASSLSQPRKSEES